MWDALTFTFVFVVAFVALLWIASRLYENIGPKGPVVPLAMVAIALFIAYAVVSQSPHEQECVETSPQGSGRC